MTILVIDFSFLLLSGEERKKKVAKLKKKIKNKRGEIEILTRAIDSSDGLCRVLWRNVPEKCKPTVYKCIYLSIYIYLSIGQLGGVAAPLV